MDRLRGFEIAKGYENKGIHLPIRKTKNWAYKRINFKSAYHAWANVKFKKEKFWYKISKS